eukprot:15364652-Ditylum_brightwellii.AAC.1
MVQSTCSLGITAVGMLSFCQGTSQPEIAMGVNQCARFTNQPMLSHERALRRIVKYLSTAADRGIVFEPNPNLGFPVLWQSKLQTDIALSTEEAEYIALSSAIHEFSPKAKHIALKYHHFRKYVTDGKLVILPISTKGQMADIFTNPLGVDLLCYLRKKLNDC